MKVLFINNEGGGFADEIDVKKDITIEKFFAEQMKGDDPKNYLIRVNREIVPARYVVKGGDRITITPTNIEGGK